jgi:hypothetical protein
MDRRGILHAERQVEAEVAAGALGVDAPRLPGAANRRRRYDELMTLKDEQALGEGRSPVGNVVQAGPSLGTTTRSKRRRRVAQPRSVKGSKPPSSLTRRSKYRASRWVAEGSDIGSVAGERAES